MAQPLAEYLVDAARRESALVREELIRLDCEASLLDYVRALWPVLEPRRKLVEGWCLEALCEHLEAVHYGQIVQLLVNIPPGLMKSLMTNVFFPTWEWGPRDRADLRYVSFAYSDRLTIRDNRKSRQLILSAPYQRFWGDRFRLSGDQNAVAMFSNDRTGFRFASSVRGTGTGERGDRLVIDDAHKISEVYSDTMREKVIDWFADEIVTRVNDDGSAVIAIGQRSHLKDVYGHMLRSDLGFEWLCLPMEFESTNRSFTAVPRKGIEPEEVALVQPVGDSIPRWVHEDEAEALVASGQLPAYPLPTYELKTPQDRRTVEGELLWPERFSRAFVENRLKKGLRSNGGNYAVAAQLQQRPSPREGGLMKFTDFKIMDRAPEQLGVVIRGWDLAGTASKRSPYTAGVKMTLSGTDVVILDVRRDQVELREVYSLIAATVVSDGGQCIQDLPQDPGQAGKDQKRHIRNQIRDLIPAHPELYDVRVHFSPETGSKVTRASGLASEGEAGTLWLVRGPWNDAFIAECVNFPNGDFADQVDAASRAYARLVREQQLTPNPVGPEEIRG